MTRLRRQMDAGCAVEQDLVVEQNAPLVRTHETANRVEHQCFARAARAEQYGHARGHGKFQVERESSGIGPGRERFAKARLNHRAPVLSGEPGGWRMSG